MTAMWAKILDDVLLQRVEKLPNGVKVAIVRCQDFSVFHTLPDAIVFEHEHYGRTGWNSDTRECYYRTDALMAKCFSTSTKGD